MKDGPLGLGSGCGACKDCLQEDASSSGSPDASDPKRGRSGRTEWLSRHANLLATLLFLLCLLASSYLFR